MVGFGSSLRACRRPGWEAAYLDYETLKLLLSQIEAVYEEEGHRRQHAEGADGTPQATSDYRDELFLESDSDEAYASVDDGVDDDEYSNSAGSAGEDPFLQAGGGLQVQGLHRRAPSSSKPFFMSYSDDPSSSEDEGTKSDGCGAGVSYSLSSWTNWEKPKIDENKKRRNLGTSALEEEDAFYMQGSNVNKTNNAFYLAGDMNSQDGYTRF